MSEVPLYMAAVLVLVGVFFVLIPSDTGPTRPSSLRNGSSNDRDGTVQVLQGPAAFATVALELVTVALVQGLLEIKDTHRA